jgi:ubiquinone/menaquinone biosynthesis C-methylase UbiE
MPPDYLTRQFDFADPRFTSIFDEASLWASHFGAFMLKHLELQRGSSILDLGCGNGFPLFELAHVHGVSCRMLGVEVWGAALRRAAMKRDCYELSFVGLAQADGAQLPLRDACFDLIVSNLGVNNFSDAAAALRECARVAKPNARLALTTNIKGHMQEFYTVYRDVLIAHGNPAYLERLTANEDHRGAKASVCALLELAGFRVARVFEEQFQMRYLDGSALLRHCLTVVGFLDGWRAVIDAADEAAIFTTLEERLNTLAHERGALTMTIPMLYVEGRKV